jgi:ABC-type lipoprotein release transport system permease subunit
MSGGALVVASSRLRASPRRTAGTALAVALAALLVGTSVTVAYGLLTGFGRAATAADLPDVIVRFDGRSVAPTDRVLRALPGVAARAYRLEATGIPLQAGSHRTDSGAAEVVDASARRGYAIVAGHDLQGPREVVVERGLARAWGLRVGSALRVAGAGVFRVSGVAVDPQNVAFPLASQAHVWLSVAAFRDRPGVRLRRANVALLWLTDPRRTDVTLQQARATSFGIGGLRVLTRQGVQVALHDAAGVVVALLSAVALVAMLAASVLLGARAHAEVQRGLGQLGVLRAVGYGPGALVAGWTLAAAAIALPAAVAGLAAGALVAHVPADGLLETLDELPPGAALLGPLAVALAAIVLLAAAATALPVARAVRRGPVELLRGAELPRPRRRRVPGAGHILLGARLVLARRARALAAVLILAVTGALLVLLLALASLLTTLRDDPGALGRRYQLSVAAPARDAALIARIPGVQAAAPRYAIDAVGSFALQEPIRVIAFGADHTTFEAPPLASGRRLRSDQETEVGQGLADALGLHVGGLLAIQTQGGELRLRVVGIVRALEHDGRVAYARAGPVLHLLPGAPGVIAIRLRAGANAAAVRRAVTARTGIEPGRPAVSTPRNRAFLATLASLLRVLAAVVGGVGMLAIVQALAVTVRERRATIAVLRAGGAGTGSIARLLAGSVAVLAIPSALLALVIERALFGPAVTSLAAGYADLSLVPSPAIVVVSATAFAAVAAAAAGLTTRAVVRATVAEGLDAE